VKGFKYDEIGYWSEIKLDIVRKYATAYSTVMNAQTRIKKHVYIDAFAGAGWHVSKRTREFVPGSPLNALAVQPPFKEFHLIDLDGGKAEELRISVGDQEDVFVYEEDANSCLLEKVFPHCRYEDYSRGLCLVDPYRLDVEWNVLQTAGKMKSIEIFYNFMIMDANMNVLWHHPDKVAPNQFQRLDKVWGDRSWRDAAYRMIPTLFGDKEEKTENEAVAEAFRKRLQEVAGFKYVPQPMPMRNENGSVVYYLYFASPNKTGAEIVEDIFSAYRTRGMK
jgi:three-Cys-motif partner protein